VNCWESVHVPKQRSSLLTEHSRSNHKSDAVRKNSAMSGYVSSIQIISPK
jgi:hypothetical protein